MDDDLERVDDLERRVDEIWQLASRKGALPIWRHCLGCETRFAVFVVSRRDGQAITVCPLCRSERIIIIGKVSE